jgi:hypothetical protein
VIGEITMSSNEVNNIADSLRPEFTGDSYNLLTKNCNSFADSFSNALLGKPIPPFVNRMAYFG